MWARASNLDRHLECPAASWLPRDEHGEWRPGYLQNEANFIVPFEDNKEDSVFAEWGTKMHLAKELSPLAEDPYSSIVAPHQARMWPSELMYEWGHEIPVRFNCRTRIATQGPRHGSEAWKKLSSPDDVTGTCDWVGTLTNGELWVDDLKTGHATPDPCSNQLKFYAMCFMLIRGLNKGPNSTVRVSATHWRREWEKPERIWSQLKWSQLEEFQEQLVGAWRHALGNELGVSPRPQPGVHCNYCPSLMVCEAINGIDYTKIGEI